jgi:hypothetical protein
MKEGGQKLVMARFSGLLSQGSIRQVESELPGYQDKLDPGDYARVVAEIRQAKERKGAADYAGQAALQSRVNAYFDGMLTGGQDAAPRPSDSEVEAQLGQRGLFEFRQQEKLYQASKASLGDFGVLSADGMQSRIAELAAQVRAGGPEYDLHAKVLATAQKAMDAQLQARASDAAAWAMTGDGTANDPSKLITGAWQAAQNEKDPKEQTRLLRVYANATTARQQSVGISHPVLLPVSIAKSIVTGIHDAKDDRARGDLLLGLASNLGQWGENKGEILKNLSRRACRPTCR